ncbi:response regulator transcription factor [uncultured Kordia sp.]|uniref:response regulator transcription factor n=1 Tax=uncultured Kordia sp. TaxID=507699 RepID=UPI0026301E25|nr:response regulator transcription factor [uncultured Kordia sp.]
MTNQTISVGIADDHMLFREGVKLIIENFENITPVLEAENGHDLFTQLKNNVPDVILLDLEMPVMDGIEATQRLREEYPDVKILILSMHKEQRMITYLMEIGANGYLLKDAAPETFEEAIRTVYAKGFYFNEFVSHAMLNGLRDKSKTPPKIGKDFHLTSREEEVLALIAEGLTTVEIGEKLFLSKRTIEGHRNNLLSKLGAKNTASLIIKAIKENLIIVD